MKPFVWKISKNLLLQTERHISFETVVSAIAQGGILDIVDHHNPEKYPSQRIFIVKIRDYAWLVPFEEKQERIVLKTIIPSRRATQKYLRSLQ